MKARAIFFLPLLLILSFFSACEEDDLRTISFEDSDIQYHRSVTRMKANKLGRYLKDNGYFEIGNRKEVIISKDDLVYVMKWEVDADFIPQPEALTYFYELKDSLNKYVFDKNELNIILYGERNRYENWALTDEIPSYHRSENHIIYYKEPVTLKSVKDFGAILDKQDFFNPKGEVFIMEKERSKTYLGLASNNQKSNEFKKRFSELRSQMILNLNDKESALVFEIRGVLLDGIEETISSPFYPKMTNINGIEIKYDLSITNDDIQTLRDFIRFKRLRNPDWMVFLRTDDKGAGRYKLIMPPMRSITDPEDIETAKNIAKGLSQRLLGSYVDVELVDEKNDKKKLIRAENM